MPVPPSKEVPEPGPSLSELEAPLAGPATTRVAFGRLHLCGPAIPSQVSGDSGGAQGFRSDRAATFNGVPVPFLIIEPGERLGSKPASCAHAIMMAHEMLKGVSCGRALWGGTVCGRVRHRQRGEMQGHWQVGNAFPTHFPKWPENWGMSFGLPWYSDTQCAASVVQRLLW